MSSQKQKGFGYGGFAIKPKGIGLETQLAQMGYGLPSMSGRSQSSVLHIGKKRVRSEDELVLTAVVVLITVTVMFLLLIVYNEQFLIASECAEIVITDIAINCLIH